MLKEEIMIKKLVASIMILFMTLSFSIPSVAAREWQITRISGKDRYETSIEVSRRIYPYAKYAIVASGENFPDALIGGTLASQILAPIFLTNKTSIREETLQEIRRLDVEEIFILGGTAAVTPEVEKELVKIAPVERIAGKDRYETAHYIFEKRYELRLNQEEMTVGDGAYFVSGTDFPDALAAAPLIGQTDKPETSLMSYLYPIRPGEDPAPFTVFGGPSAIYHSYDHNYPDYLEPRMDYRIAGTNRYGTAVEIAKKYPEIADIYPRTVILVNGRNYPDALSAAPIAPMTMGAILLTDPNYLPQETKDYIEESEIWHLVVVGGESAVSEKVVQEILEL